jgi:hypothetical protein
MTIRFRTLLLTAIALLLIWYLTGGRDEIAWYKFVRQSKAQGGWDLSQADRWPNHGILFFLSGIGIYIVLVLSAFRFVGMLVKKFSKARG